MALNRYEESVIQNSKLPSSWQSAKALAELDDFLQQNWAQRSVFYEDGKVESRQQFLGFVGNQGIRTKNYIGTIVFNGVQLNIFPKVFRESRDEFSTEDLTLEHMMYNLVRWLEYCNRMAYPFINISAELNDVEDLRELFITLYIGYVRSAIERGCITSMWMRHLILSVSKANLISRIIWSTRYQMGRRISFSVPIPNLSLIIRLTG